MFARSRSFLLARFNVGFLTCCVLVIGTVSSMSLDRLGRQYQQQNDKQLDLNEFMLPEADSDLLQNDMELVPAIDGNSDMYLLVPASAFSQDPNLQSLTELKESQNSQNVENNSDMLMLESEDLPEVHFFKLPEYETQSKNDQELQANEESDEISHFTSKNKEEILNDNDQEVSDSMIDAIAETAQEIENEIETELMESEEIPKDEESQKTENIEHKDGEVENANVEENEDVEGEMIGVVSEESSEEPVASLENESQQESEKNNEDLQAVEFEVHLIHQGQKQTPETTMGESLEEKSDQNFPKETTGEKNENANEGGDEPETIKHENDQMEEGVLEDEEHRKGEADKTPIDIQEQTFETNMEINSDDGSRIESDAEAMKFVDADDASINREQQDEAVVKPLVEETAVVENVHENATKNDATRIDETNSATTDEIQVDAIQPERNEPFEEGQVDVKITEAEQPNKEAEDFIQESQADTEEQPSKYIQEHIEPIQTELLEETHVVSESEKPQTDEEIVNQEDSGNDITVGEKEPNTEISNVGTDSMALSHMPLEETEKFEQSQLISESQIIENSHGADEEISSVEETAQQQLVNAGKVSQKDQQNEKLESFENSQVPMVAPSADTPAEVPEKLEDIENFPSISKDAQAMEDSDLIVDVQTESSEKVHSDKEMPSVEKFTNVEEILTLANTDSVVKAQTANELRPVEVAEDALFAQNTRIPEEIAYNEEAESVESTEDNQSLEKAPPVKITQSDEKTKIQSTEDSLSLEDPSIEDTQPVEYISFLDVQQSAEDTVPTEESSYKDVAVGTEVKLMESTATGTTSTETQPTENLESETVDKERPKLSSNEFLPAEANKKAGELADNYTLQNVETVQTNKNQEIQTTATEIQRPLEDKNSDNIINYEPIKTNASILTSIVQVPAKVEMPQHQEKNEQIQEQQPAIVETISSTTLRPLYALDTVFNYVNASFMNQANTDDDNNRQEGNEKEQAFSSQLRRYDGAQVWRIVVQNDKERKLADELQTKFDGQLWKEVKQEVDYLLKPQVLADAEHHVRAANLTRIVLIDNLQKVIEVENPPAEEIAQLQNRKGYRLTWQAYHRLEDIHSYFDYLAKTYPDICSVEIIGYSIEKRPLKILKISNGNATNPGIWIDGGMHAREWISPAVVTYITNQIVEGWDDLPAYLRNINWYVHAVANPDGYEYSHTTDRLWRKNRRSHGRACPGVDLNRNFGYKWGGQGTSANPCAQTYRGSKAFSEPETFYISKFISNFPRETFKAYLSFHSYGQYILYPWGYGYHLTKDMPDLDLVARQAGTIITKSSGAKFTVGSSATTLYPAAGGSDDWAKGIAGIKYSYTIEMGDTGRYGFVLPASYIESNGKNGLIVVETVAKAITMGKTARKRKLKAYKIH